MADKSYEGGLDDQINFICPICKKDLSELAGDSECEIDVVLDPNNNQMYHKSCLDKEEVKEND